MALIQQYLTEAWALIAEMGSYLLLGFLVAGLLHRWFRQQWIKQRLGSPGWMSTAFASLVGVPMPLCSCGVIPVTASLREKGASKGVATSFLTSTPQAGIDSILGTNDMLGTLFAIYRVFIAFLSDFVIGAAVDKFGQALIRESDINSDVVSRKIGILGLHSQRLRLEAARSQETMIRYSRLMGRIALLSLALFGADFNRGYASEEFRFESFLGEDVSITQWPVFIITSHSPDDLKETLRCATLANTQKEAFWVINFAWNQPDSLKRRTAAKLLKHDFMKSHSTVLRPEFRNAARMVLMEADGKIRWRCESFPYDHEWAQALSTWSAPHRY